MKRAMTRKELTFFQLLIRGCEFQGPNVGHPLVMSAQSSFNRGWPRDFQFWQY